MKANDLAERFCSLPWMNVDVGPGGSVHVCCPAWCANRSIGNIFTSSVEAVWNSDQAVLFREGILNGTFDQCDQKKCSPIIAKRLPRRDQIQNEWHGAEMQQIIDKGTTRVDRGPRVVKLSYDSSCNLTCPSCRTELLMAKKADQDRLDRILHESILPLLKDAEVLIISGDGDPFASKHYRDVMSYTKVAHPSLKLCLATNGVLFDERAWLDCELEGRVCRVQVSIDAADPMTYARVRRGGDFARLMRNLEFLSGLRRDGRMGPLDILFVVQTRNYGEMPDFIRLGKSLGVDSVQFMLIDFWGRGMDRGGYAAAKIWDTEHPLYPDFISLMSDPIFDDPIVELGNVQAIRDGWQPVAIEVGRTGKFMRHDGPVPAQDF